MKTQNALDSLDPRKAIAVLFLLPDCDMACRFCGGEEGYQTMAFEQATALLRSLRKRSIRNVVLGGGEAFLWPHDLVGLTEVARDLGFLVQVSTSGTALPSGFANLASVDRYILPLEAMDPQVHDRLRPYRLGHHELILDAITRLAATGKELTVSTVVTRENIGHLSGVASYLEGLRADGASIHAWHLYRFLAIGRAGQQNFGELSVPDASYRAACRELRERELGFPVYRRLDMLRSRTIEYLWYEGNELRIGSHVLARRAVQDRHAVAEDRPRLLL